MTPKKATKDRKAKPIMGAAGGRHVWALYELLDKRWHRVGTETSMAAAARWTYGDQI